MLRQQTAGLWSALVNPKQRHENDKSTFQDLNWDRYHGVLPNGLTLQWLGTAGFSLQYEGYTLLIDPYVSRPKLSHVLRNQYLRPNLSNIDNAIHSADAILVGHTHFDHVLDVPHIVEKFDCDVFGSESLRQLLSLYQLQHRATVVDSKKIYHLGPFEVSFVPSLHSKMLMGLKVPMEGEICCEHLDCLSSGQYKCGQVFGIHIKVADVTFYHQGSANLIEENIHHKNVDYFLCGISGRSFTHHYTKRILEKLSPKIVIPHHFDNFFTDIQEPIKFIMNVNIGGFVDEVEKVSKEFEVRTLNLFQKI